MHIRSEKSVFRFVFQLGNNNFGQPLQEATHTMIASTQTNHPLHGAVENSPSAGRVDNACARLRSSGLRITQPRIAILKVLTAHENPVSIEQIHGELSDKSCDLVTVYRCLAAFEEIGLVRRSFFHNGTSLYQMGDGKQNAYHVVSKDTGEIRPLDADASKDLSTAIDRVENILKSQGYTEVSHIVEFFAKGAATSARAGQVSVPASL
jgi:Fur family transcriptional regulator, ferric uptake regulator